MTTPAINRARRPYTRLELLPPPDYSYLEPLPDPPIDPDARQYTWARYFHSTLKIRFIGRRDMLVAGKGYLRRMPYDHSEVLAPDCIVAFGVNPKNIISRNGYVISEVGKPPDFVFEVARRGAGRRDYAVKREAYARYGVGEYWRFEHTGSHFYEPPLTGDILTGNGYEPISTHNLGDGVIWGYSPLLGLDLYCYDGELRFRDPETGEFLFAPEEPKHNGNGAIPRASASQSQSALSDAEDSLLRDTLRRLFKR